MAAERISIAIGKLLRSLPGSTYTSTTDGELLKQFLTIRDEAAFAALVRRHGAMVLGVCRRILGNVDDAEDAFQATFIVLVRKAASLTGHPVLGAWLHGVARRVALKARTAAAGRRLKEQTLARTERPAEESRNDWLPLLDEQVSKLPEKYRLAIVLCDLEGKTRREAAAQLGWPEGTVAGRLARGRALLAKRLMRAVQGPPGTVPALLACGAADTLLPPGLLHSTTQAAGLAVAGPLTVQGALSANAVFLAKGVLQAMLFTQVKVAAATVLMVALCGAGLTAWGRGHNPPPAAAAQAKNEPAEPAVKPAELTTRRTLRIVVLDSNGKPLPEAKVLANISMDEKPFVVTRHYQTDSAGAVQVELPKTLKSVRLWAGKKSLVTMFAGWETKELATMQEFPPEYVFRLEPGATAGGRIVDEQGKPIVGAKVRVKLSRGGAPAGSDGRASYDWSLTDQNDPPRTDSEGRWRIDNVPNHPKVELVLLVTHPDYVSDQRWEEAQKAANITTAMLRQGTATLTLKHGARVHGRVTDPAGKPIKDAIVVRGDDPYWSETPAKFPTDSDGQFFVGTLAPGETALTVIARGWAPQRRLVKLHAGLPPQVFRMEPGKPIQLRFIDSAGKPVPHVYVDITEWRGSKSLQSSHNPNHPKVPDYGIPRPANDAGVWEWSSAPIDRMKLEIYGTGLAPVAIEIAGGAPLRTVTLKPEHRIMGRVTDAATGKPIPNFTVIPVDLFRPGWRHAERQNAIAATDGRLEYLATRTDIPLQIRIEARGYRTQDGPEFRVGDDTPRTQDFRLQPGQAITGTVVDEAGRPVENAQILLATPSQEARFLPPKSQEMENNRRTFTDTAGRFEFPDPGEPWAVLVQANAGFAFAEFPSGGYDAGKLHLRPWASVRGRFRDGGQPVRGATVLLDIVRVRDLSQPNIHATISATTDADGRFAFSRVPPLPVSVGVYLGPWKDEGFRSGPRLPLDLQPGQSVDLDLGGPGATISGNVKLTGKIPADLDCTYSLNYLVRRAPGIAPPLALARLGFDARNGWNDTWRKTNEGQAYLSTLLHWFVKLAPDGAFRISGVPPGEYDLAIEIYAKPSG